jgi:hypothetical protein
MARTEESSSSRKSGNPSPASDERASEDRKVDLTPFDFLTMRLRGPAADDAPSSSETGSGDGT